MPADEPGQPPARCPACRSTDLITTSKATDASYWRCRACGEVWNAKRRFADPRYGGWTR
jgi:hypothetical protein